MLLAGQLELVHLHHGTKIGDGNHDVVSPHFDAEAPFNVLDAQITSSNEHSLEGKSNTNVSKRRKCVMRNQEEEEEEERKETKKTSK